MLRSRARIAAGAGIVAITLSLRGDDRSRDLLSVAAIAHGREPEKEHGSEENTVGEDHQDQTNVHHEDAKRFHRTLPLIARRPIAISLNASAMSETLTSSCLSQSSDSLASKD